MTTATTFVWRGVELPVWRFDTFDDFEHFMETLLPVEQADTAEAGFEIFADLAPEASGVLFSSDGHSDPLAVVIVKEHLEDGVTRDCEHPSPDRKGAR